MSDLEHRAEMRVSLELLSGILSLPKGTRVFSVRYDPVVHQAVLSIEHESLPEVRPGEMAMTVNPVFSTNLAQVVPRVTFEKWGLPE